jgi:hypothetical protein
MRTSMNEQNNTNISQFNSNCSSRTPSNSIKDVSSIDLQQEGSTLTIQASGVAEQTNVVKSRVRQNNLHWRDDQQVFSKHDAYSSKRVRNVGRGGKLRSSPANILVKLVIIDVTRLLIGRRKSFTTSSSSSMIRKFQMMLCIPRD